MKFAIGYQQPEVGGLFPKILADYRESVEEVYFAWPETPSGRRMLGPDTVHECSYCDDVLKSVNSSCRQRLDEFTR